MAFKKLLFWLPGAVSFLSICAIGYMPVVLKSQSDSETEIRVLTERYFAAYAKKDLNGLTSLWSEKSPELAAGRQSFQQTFAANTTMEMKRLIVRKVTLTGDKATARVVIEIDAIDAKTRKRSEELVKQYRTLHFTNEGVWRVWRDVSSEEELAAAISKAKTDAEREVLLEADKELITVELRKGLTSQAIQFANRGSYTQANPIFQLSLNIAQDLGEKVGIAVNLRGIGFVYASQGKYTEALEYHRRSLAISEEIEDKPGIVRVLNLIGVVHQSQGNYTLALEHCRKSLAISVELGDKPATAGTLHNIGNIHWSQGNYAQALEYYQKSLAISVEVSDKIRIPRLLNNIGNVHQLRGSYPQSLEYYQKSLALSMELDDRLGTATALNNLGVIHQLQGNYPQALEHYQKSLTISKELGDKTGVVRGLNNVGEIQNLQASYAQAIDLATQAAVMAGQIGSLEMLWQAQTTTGQAYQALNKTEQAQRAFSDAIAAIEQLRDQIAGGEQQRQLFFEGKVSPYHAMVDLLISQNNPAQALRFAERAKARALLDVLQSGQTNVTKAMTVEERERERILNSELVSLNTQIYREKSQDQPDQSRLNDLTGRLKNTRLQIEAFHTNLYAAHPELKIYRGDIRPITIKEIAPLIPDSSTALLEYVVTENKTHLFVLTRRKPSRGRLDLKLFTLSIKQKDLTDRVEQFRTRLANRDFTADDLGRDLYSLLLKPASAELKGKTSLIIVPDRVLWDLSFQALKSSQDRYLIEDAALSYAPSFTTLREILKPKTKPTNRTRAGSLLLAFGNPSIRDEMVKREKSVFMDEKLEPLPEAERQVRMLAQVYGAHRSKIYLQADATEERAKAEAGNYRILHLATHGILNDASPMYSHVLLAQPGVGSKEDGTLEAWEIMNLNIDADVVVLSACETARGRVGAGEGVIGLTWALFVAGSPTTVASQWKVEVQSTTELMVEFHRNLRSQIENPKSKMTKAKALRQAGLKLLRSEQYRHPFYWAGFVIIGSGG